MIVVKIELWKKGDEFDKIELGRAYISNQGGTQTRGEYHARIQRNGLFDRQFMPLRSGAVHNFPRLSYNVWRLVIRSLLVCFPEEKNPEIQEALEAAVEDATCEQ